MTGPSKAERIAEVVGCVIGIVGVLIFAVWSRSLFSFGKEHLLQFEPHSGNRVAAGPEVLADAFSSLRA